MSVTTSAGVEQKTCTHCKKTKPRDAFAGNASNADGLQRHCRECMRTMRGRGAEKAPAGAVTMAPAGSILASLPLSAIVASLTNPRRHFHPARMAELAESIKASGVHQPVLVRPLPGNRVGETFQDRRKGDPLPTHEIIAGERRYRASQLAGMPTIPVLITSMTDDKVLELQIVENLQRDDLHPMEEAEGYQRLCDATGITKDDIGAKIGKSRSYVYQRIKLIDLAQAARDAFIEGKIDMSRALIIARCPDTKLQLKALTEATRQDWRGDVPSVRSFQTWAQQNIMLKLDAARFKITDASLVPEAGSCDQCPKRTGASPDLFADVDSADVCIDPACFHLKEAAHEEAVMAVAKAKGQRIIPEREAKKLWSYEHNKIDGYVRLDRPDDRVGGSKMLKTVLGKDMPEPILMQNPHKKGELIEVLPADKVRQMLKDSGRISPQQARSDRVISASEAKQNALIKFEKTWRKRAINRVHDEINGMGEDLMTNALVFKPIALQLLDGLRGDERQHVCELLGLGKVADRAAIESYLSECDALQTETTMLLLIMQHDMQQLVSYGNGEPIEATRIQAVAKKFGIDLDTIRADVKAEFEEAAKPKKLPASAPAASLKTKDAKKSTASPAAQKVRARKPSAEEVQAQIAEKLQALEREQNQAPHGAEPEEGAAYAAGDHDQAPGGASKEENAAPAAPAWPFPNKPAAKPTIDVGTRVKVKKTLAGTGGEHAGKEGTVSGQVVGKSCWQVKFPGRGGKAAKIVEFDADMLEVLA